MNDLTLAAGASSTVDIDGNAYTLSPLTIGDMADFAQWAHDRAFEALDVKIARREKYGGCTADEKKALLKETEEAITRGSAEAKAAMSFDGIAKMAHLSLRHQHSDLSLDQVRNAVSLLGMKKLQQRLDQMSGLDDEDADPNVGSPAPAGQTGATSSVDSSTSSDSAPGKLPA